MGNLGQYQDLVTEAKRLGGVEKLIETIEDAAVAKAVPKAFAAGAAVSVVAAAGVAAIAKRVTKRAKARDALADDAKARLRSGFREIQPSEESSEVVEAAEQADLNGSLEDGSLEDGSPETTPRP